MHPMPMLKLTSDCVAQPLISWFSWPGGPFVLADAGRRNTLRFGPGVGTFPRGFPSHISLASGPGPLVLLIAVWLGRSIRRGTARYLPRPNDQLPQRGRHDEHQQSQVRDQVRRHESPGGNCSREVLRPMRSSRWSGRRFMWQPRRARRRSAPCC